ncbi:(Lyso)-N-acylphosphatidylethanolamine lipase-like [Ptychodera flava]|uniref:(Lyso)-N-acylphosphatidylethanolamine lipase-like n=1 Tax=Ptychodera flava TaxID=63121 RepID=UPI00396A8E62
MADTLAVSQRSNRNRRSCRYRWKWVPSSAATLEATETKILRRVNTDYEGRFVSLGESLGRLWTVTFNPTNSEKTPFVFVHGFGAGVALWAKNIAPLCQQRPFHAFDLLGFGRSSRLKFPRDDAAVEERYIRSIERWRVEMKLDKMILVGHSFGGYLVTSYALKYPDRVKHLIPVDPWGFPDAKLPILSRAIGTVFTGRNGAVLSILRVAGPFGLDIMNKTRRDLREKYSDLFDDNTITNYIYHCNVQYPSGEKAFSTLSESLGYAKRPMINRIEEMRKDVPITFIYGRDTYSIIDPSVGEKIQEMRHDAQVEVFIIDNASHQVYADQPTKFNNVMLQICKDIQ